MRLSQIYRTFSIIDMKTLVEYCANSDGYTENLDFSKLNGGAVCTIKDSASITGRISRAFYQLIRRLPAGCLYPLFEEVKQLNVNAIFYRTMDATEIIDILELESFKHLFETEYVRNAICNNEYTKRDAIPLAVYNSYVSIIFSDSQQYSEYITKLKRLVLDAVKVLYTKCTSILSLYCTIPQLHLGLLNSSHFREHAFMMRDESMILGMFAEFEHYMMEVSFSAERNSTTVVECYVGMHMKFFLPRWYREYFRKYNTAKTVVGIDEDNNMIFAADLLTRKDTTPKVYIPDTNIVGTFEKVNAIDWKLFGTRKQAEHRPTVGYKSIMDSVIPLVCSSKLLDLNYTLSKEATTRGLSLSFVPVDDILSKYQNTDISLIRRLKRGEELIRTLYKRLGSLTPESALTSLTEIVRLNNTNVTTDKGDSNVAIISTRTLVGEGQEDTNVLEFLTDSDCEIIRSIIDVTQELLNINSILEEYNTNLAFLWKAYTSLEPKREGLTLRTHPTVLTYLSFVLSRQELPINLVHDGIYSNNRELEILDISDAQLVDFNEIIRTPVQNFILPNGEEIILGNAVVPVNEIKSSKSTGKELIEESFNRFSSLALDSFKEYRNINYSLEANNLQLTGYSNYQQLVFLYHTMLGVVPELEVQEKILYRDNPYDLRQINQITLHSYCNTMIYRLMLQKHEGVSKDAITEKVFCEYQDSEDWDTTPCNELTAFAVEVTETSGAQRYTLIRNACLNILYALTRAISTRDEIHKDLVRLRNTLAKSPEYLKTANLAEFFNILISRQIYLTPQMANSTFTKIAADPSSITDQTILDSFALYQVLYIAYAILWLTVYYTQNQPEGSNISTCVLGDINLITDMGIALLDVQFLIDSTLPRYMQPFISQQKKCKQLLTFATNYKMAVSFTQATILHEVAFSSIILSQDLFSKLAVCSDICMNTPTSTTRPLAMLEQALSEIKGSATNILLNGEYEFDDVYTSILVEAICNMIYMHTHSGKLGECKECTGLLAEHYQVFGNYLSTYLQLGCIGSAYFTSAKKRITMYDTEKLIASLETPDYSSYKLMQSNVSQDIKQQFNELRYECSLDANGFYYKPHKSEYVLALDEEQRYYYLSSDGIWISINFLQGGEWNPIYKTFGELHLIS